MKNVIVNLASIDANSEYTSATVLADTADSITGVIVSNQAGTLHVEQSGDGNLATPHWDVDDTIAITANTAAKISLPLLLPYVRLRFVKTSTAPTTLRVFARLASAGVQS